MTLGSLFENINKATIERLVADGVPEGQHIDYKEQLPGTAPGDKKEFLADVASFATSGGGDLVFGIAERRDAAGKATGIADAARGVGNVNVDAELLRIDNMIRDGIAPRVPIRTLAVAGFLNGPVIVVRVARTTTGPHMVTFERHNKFYGRSNGGKYLLGVDEIRSAFNAAAEAVERAFRFRDSRIAAVVSGSTPVAVEGAALLLLVVPDNAALGASRLDPRNVPRERIPLPLSGGGNSGYVAEGVVLRADDGYSLVMRSGALEGVYDFSRRENPQHRIVPTLKVEREAVRFVRESVALLESLDLFAPYRVFGAFIGVKDFPLAAPTEMSVGHYERRFDRDLLTLPDVELPSADRSEVTARLRPMFEGMWQAVGWASDPYYENGESAKW
jgi:hypothetical protein